jgi:hypothetical protein
MGQVCHRVRMAVAQLGRQARRRVLSEPNNSCMRTRYDLAQSHRLGRNVDGHPPARARLCIGLHAGLDVHWGDVPCPARNVARPAENATRGYSRRRP